MTLRPFTIINGNLWITRIQTHRGEDLIKKSIKIPKNFYKKLLSYPITAFGYELGIHIDEKFKINPKFDRTDVIKALDFWIEHWVYQNKKDYILEGTVNKDFELSVRELIEFREAVLKMPVDTQFVRQKIRSIAEIKEIKPKMVEFTENVVDSSNSVSGTVDQFCYVVRKMTYKKYMDQKNKPYATGSVMYNYEENFRGNNRFDFGDRTSGLMSGGGRHTDTMDSRGNWITNFNNDPRTWRPVPERDGSGWKVVDQNGINVARNFITSDQAQNFINERIPSSEVGSVPTELDPFEIRGPDHLLHSNLHPGIPESFNLNRIATTEELNLRPSSTEQEIIERGRLLGLNEQQIRDLIELMRWIREKEEEEDN